MQNNRIYINLTGWVIAIGIFYSLMAISSVGLTHEHDHRILGSTDCSACFFSANHFGIELLTVDVTNLDACISTHSSFDFTFISTILDDSVQSRAPPVFSV